MIKKPTSSFKNQLQENRSSIQARMPILDSMSLSLAAQCEDAIKLSKLLVKGWF